MQKNQIFLGTRIVDTILPWWLSVSMIAASTGACNASGAEDVNTEAANKAVTAADQAASEASLLVSITAGIDPNQAPEDLASASAALADGMEPGDCASTQVTGAQVQWNFHDCTGPFGRVRVNGTVTATFRMGPRGTTVDVTSSDLSIDDAAVDITATMVLQESTNGQSLDVDGALQADTRVGPMTQTGAFTVTWEDATSCVSLEGTWNADFGGRTWKTTAEGLISCPDACLTGSLEFKGTSRTYSLTFSDNGEVSWSLESGQGGTIKTTCSQ